MSPEYETLLEDVTERVLAFAKMLHNGDMTDEDAGDELGRAVMEIIRRVLTYRDRVH